MKTRRAGGWFGLSAIVALTGCTGGADNFQFAPCTPGASSLTTIGTDQDPCPQSDTDCSRVGGRAFALCLPDTTWDSQNCACDATRSDAGTGVPCGNGVIDTGEQCDGVNFQGTTCTTLGYSSGTLVCDPMSCIVDSSMCIQNGAGGGGNGG
jgi:hypothetical protein